jgi:hypothetical protein
MIDDSSLIQVFATVLIGVLIFLTLERRFERKEDYIKKFDKLNEERDSLFKELSELQDERLRVKSEHSKNVEFNPMYRGDPIHVTKFKRTMNDLNGKIAEKCDKIKTTAININSLNRKYEQTLNQYSNLRTKEGLVTFFMVVTLSASIIGLLPLAFFEFFDMKLISTLLFSVAVGLLIARVYLHGRNLDRLK